MTCMALQPCTYQSKNTDIFLKQSKKSDIYVILPENQSINADIYGIYQSKRTPASGKLKCSV